MASPVVVEHLTARLAQQAYLHTGAPATDIAWVDMRDFSHLLVGLSRISGTGNIDSFRILANAESDGSGTDVEIVVHPLTAQPNAVNDQIYLEVEESQVRAEGEKAGQDVRYVSANVDLATGADQVAIIYTRKASRHAYQNLTPDRIA